MKKAAFILVGLIALLPAFAFAETWMDDCNTCSGDPNGVYSCTTLYCGPNPKLHFGELKIEWMNKEWCKEQLETKSDLHINTIFFIFGGKYYELGRREDGVIVSREWTDCEDLYR